MSREAMAVVYWARPDKRRNAEGVGVGVETAKRPPTRLHVSRDRSSACGSTIPPDAMIVAVTPDWHELTTCYNCAYRLWAEFAPPGFVRPRNSHDFPPRRECPHHPGQGHDSESCPRWTSGVDKTAERDAVLPGTAPQPRPDDNNPDEPRPQELRNAPADPGTRSTLSAVARKVEVPEEPIEIAVEQLNLLVSTMGSAPTPEDRLAVGMLAAQIELALRLRRIERSVHRGISVRLSSE